MGRWLLVPLLVVTVATQGRAEQAYTLLYATPEKTGYHVLEHYASAAACRQAARDTATRQGLIPQRLGGELSYMRSVNGVAVGLLGCDAGGSDFWEAEIRAGRAVRGATALATPPLSAETSRFYLVAPNESRAAGLATQFMVLGSLFYGAANGYASIKECEFARAQALQKARQPMPPALRDAASLMTTLILSSQCRKLGPPISHEQAASCSIPVAAIIGGSDALIGGGGRPGIRCAAEGKGEQFGYSPPATAEKREPQPDGTGLRRIEPPSRAAVPQSSVPSPPPTPTATLSMAEYRQAYRAPGALGLRRALNGFLSGSNEGLEGERVVAALQIFPRSAYRGRFIILSVQDGSLGGRYYQIFFPEGDEHVFLAWMYPLGGTDWTLRVFEEVPELSRRLPSLRERLRQDLRDPGIGG